MELIIQYFAGQPFVSNPYAPGTSLRQDLFERQFTIVFFGEKLIGDNQDWTSDYGHIQIAHCGLLDEVMPLVSQALQRHDYPLPESVMDFWPSRITVLDRQGHLVMMAKIDHSNSSISWISPCDTVEEEQAVLDQIQLLRSQSTFEHGWDNFSTARLLDTDADLLKGRLVHKPWRPYVRALLNA